MPRPPTLRGRFQATLASILGSARLPIISISLFLALVIYIQLKAVQKLPPKEHPFEGFGTPGQEEARRVVQEKLSEAGELHTHTDCVDGPRDVPPEVIFSARDWLKPWSSAIHDHPEKRITQQEIDESFQRLEKEGYAVARIRVTNGVLRKPIMVNRQGKEEPTYVQRVARWYLLFDSLRRSHGLPQYLDIIVSTEIMPILPLEMLSLSRPPVFGYFAYPGYLDIPLPSFELYGRLRKWQKPMVLAHTWLSRNPKVFWRGPPIGSSDQHYWRKHAGAILVALGRRVPEVVDAKFEDCRPGGCSEALWKEVYKGELTSETNATYSDYLQHKYVVDIETSPLESRFSYLLSTMAVILKPESYKLEYFGEFFIPFVHYIPLEGGSTDWEKAVEQLDKDVVRVSEISRAATEAFEEYVANDRWLDYAWALLSSYALLLHPKHP